MEIPWLAHYNPEIDWRIEEVKMIKYPEECKKTVKIKVRKTGMAKTEGKREKERIIKEVRRKRVEKEKEKAKKLVL